MDSCPSVIYTLKMCIRDRLTDFCMTESQVKDYIRKYIPDVTDEQMRQWEASKALECMMLDLSLIHI